MSEDLRSKVILECPAYVEEDTSTEPAISEENIDMFEEFGSVPGNINTGTDEGGDRDFEEGVGRGGDRDFEGGIRRGVEGGEEEWGEYGETSGNGEGEGIIVEAKDDATITLSLILKAINEDDMDGLKTLFCNIDLDFINLEDFDSLLGLFMKTACSRKDINPKIVQEIVSRFERSNIHEGEFSIQTRVFILPNLTDEEFYIYVRSMPNVTIHESVEELSNNDSTPEIMKAFDNMIKAFGSDRPHKVYRELLDICGMKNEVIHKKVRELVEKTSPWIKPPSYIINDGWRPSKEPETSGESIRLEGKSKIKSSKLIDDEDIVDPEVKIDFKLLETKDAINELTMGVNLDVKSLSEFKERLRLQYEKSDDEGKRVMLAPLFNQIKLKTMESDSELFRIYGPCNPNVGINLDTIDRCNAYGGCRMFLCSDFSNFGDDGEVYDEELHDKPHWVSILSWFTGFCDKCNNKIQKPCYSMRKPGIHGGWIGCYCGEDCCISDVGDNNELSIAMIKVVAEMLRKIGIYDREYRKIPDDLWGNLNGTTIVTSHLIKEEEKKVKPESYGSDSKEEADVLLEKLKILENIESPEDFTMLGLSTKSERTPSEKGEIDTIPEKIVLGMPSFRIGLVPDTESRLTAWTKPIEDS